MHSSSTAYTLYNGYLSLSHCYTTSKGILGNHPQLHTCSQATALDRSTPHLHIQEECDNNQALANNFRRHHRPIQHPLHTAGLRLRFVMGTTPTNHNRIAVHTHLHIRHPLPTTIEVHVSGDTVQHHKHPLGSHFYCNH